MTSHAPLQRSEMVKEVVHVKVKKYSGYFNPECKRFAVDPHVTTFADLKNILVGAFNLSEPYHLSYLCRDDTGENIYLSMLTEWDLDAAFMTSSEPYLRLKVDIYEVDQLSKMCSSERGTKADIVPDGTGIYMPRTWLLSVGNAINKMASGLANNFAMNGGEQVEFFPNKPPLGDVEFREFLDCDGRLTCPDDLRLRIYYGGVEPSLRKVVWRMLLNIFPENMTGKGRIAYMKERTQQYYFLSAECRTHISHDYVQSMSRMIWKDVQRTDRTHSYFDGAENNPHITSLHNILLTYALTHQDVGYCQGMSDIAAPILAVMDSEPHGYVCFCGAMMRLQRNFSSSGDVMSKKFEHLALLVKHHDAEYFEFLKSLGADNMYFCYRWLLLEMKREFSFDDALTVMDVMWSSLPPQQPENELFLGNIDPFKCSVTKERETFLELSLNAEKLRASRNAHSFPTVCGVDSAGRLSCKEDSSNLSPPAGPCRCESQFPSRTEESYDTSLWFLNIGECDHARIKYSLLPSSDISSESSHDTPSNEKHGAITFQLPSPEEFGAGNPFLLFLCLSLLDDQREQLMRPRIEYDDLVMHFDRLVRKHPVRRILSRAMQLFASYLRSHSSSEPVAKIVA